MSLGKDVEVETLLNKMEGFSGAEIKSVCTEAGYFAIRDNRTKIGMPDLLKAIIKVKKDEEKREDFIAMFG